MKIKILGTVSPYEIENENCPGYLITYNRQNIILDCGSGISRTLEFPSILDNLTIIISHFHKDHYLDLYNLIYAAKDFKRIGKLNQLINVYVPKEPKKIVDDIIEEGKDILNVILYDEDTLINNNDDIRIRFKKTEHTDSMPSFATKIESSKSKIIYTGDASNKNIDNLIKFSENADVIICDAKFLKSNGINNHSYHMTSFEAGEYAEKANAKMLVLTHFSSYNYNPKLHLEEANINFSNCICATSNLEIKL